jgi:hypothetical protein
MARRGGFSSRSWVVAGKAGSLIYHSLGHMSRIGKGSARLQARHDQGSIRSPGVDQLLRGESGPRTQVGQVTFHGARPDAHESRRARDSASFDECSENFHLAPGRSPRECAAQVPVVHANRSTAAIHSSRPSMGMR